MPIYEYECTKCGRTVEAWQKFSDKPLKTCRECSGRLHKLISQSTFHLKGTGWYVTDYADKSKSSAPERKCKEPDTQSASLKKPKSNGKE
jgi:putative FmdB family regulatory protein